MTLFFTHTLDFNTLQRWFLLLTDSKKVHILNDFQPFKSHLLFYSSQSQSIFLAVPSHKAFFLCPHFDSILVEDVININLVKLGQAKLLDLSVPFPIIVQLP